MIGGNDKQAAIFIQAFQNGAGLLAQEYYSVAGTGTQGTHEIRFMIRPARDNQFPPLWLRACQEGVDQIVKPLFRHEPPHRQYVTLWCKAQPFDDCHRIVIARRQAWGAVWNIRHLISRSEEHTSELQSLMRISYAVFCF